MDCMETLEKGKLPAVSAEVFARFRRGKSDFPDGNPKKILRLSSRRRIRVSDFQMKRKAGQNQLRLCPGYSASSLAQTMPFSLDMETMEASTNRSMPSSSAA